jgi:hypothetical protein
MTSFVFRISGLDVSFTMTFSLMSHIYEVIVLPLFFHVQWVLDYVAYYRPGWMPYWRSMSLCTGVGLFKRASVPALVFGKAMTSRIEDALQRVATKRSKPGRDIISLSFHPIMDLDLPSAIPPWGGAPHFKAWSKWLNDSFSCLSSWNVN